MIRRLALILFLTPATLFPSAQPAHQALPANQIVSSYVDIPDGENNSDGESWITIDEAFFKKEEERARSVQPQASNILNRSSSMGERGAPRIEISKNPYEDQGVRPGESELVQMRGMMQIVLQNQVTLATQLLNVQQQNAQFVRDLAAFRVVQNTQANVQDNGPQPVLITSPSKARTLRELQTYYFDMVIPAFDQAIRDYNGKQVSEMLADMVTQLTKDAKILALSENKLAGLVKRLRDRGLYPLAELHNTIQRIKDAEQANISEAMPLLSTTDGLQNSSTATASSSLAALTTPCNICLDDKLANELVALSCSHLYCKACLNQLVDNASAERSTAQLKCPNTSCAKPLNEQDVRTITSNDIAKLTAYADICAREWLIRQPNARQCPTPNCPFVFLNDGANARATICSECNQRYCSNCLVDHERQMSCDAAKAARAGDIAYNEWKQTNTKECPQCKATIQKNGGCPTVACSQCKHAFCWNCLGPYNHLAHNCRPTTIPMQPVLPVPVQAAVPAAIPDARPAAGRRLRRSEVANLFAPIAAAATPAVAPRDPLTGFLIPQAAPDGFVIPDVVVSSSAAPVNLRTALKAAIDAHTVPRDQASTWNDPNLWKRRQAAFLKIVASWRPDLDPTFGEEIKAATKGWAPAAYGPVIRAVYAKMRAQEGSTQRNAVASAASQTIMGQPRVSHHQDIPAAAAPVNPVMNSGNPTFIVPAVVADQCGMSHDEAFRILSQAWTELCTEKEELRAMGPLRSDASNDEIRKRQRQLTSRWHPDKNANDPMATEKFTKIYEAARVLSAMIDQPRASAHPAIPMAQARAGNSVDENSALWIVQNTRPCPRCNVRIEKNGGCSHVVCQQCHHGFCWNCSGEHRGACNQPAA